MTIQDAKFATIGAGAKRTIWEGLSNGDTGRSISLPKYPDKTVQFYGDFGGGSGKLEGSNDPRANPNHADHSNAVWFTLKDVSGSLIEKTADAAETVGQAPEWIRPALDGGSGGSIDCSLVARK